MVVMPVAGGKVYLGWRLLKDDPKEVAFNVYRSTGKQPGVKLNDKPLTATTDFLDASPSLNRDNAYWVRPVVGGRELDPSEQGLVPPKPDVKPYLSFKLKGDHTFQKAGIADLNGDGRYDVVIKQPNSNIDPAGSYWKPSPGPYTLEAYLHDGTPLWQKDLGWAIEQGIWYSPYIVYDLDGDGKAEVAVKTGEGDPRDKDGRVQTGPEWLSILDGQTGQDKARVEWPSREGFPNYNVASRNQICVAYLDGKTPCVVVERGTYGTIKLAAYEFHGGRLKELWRWDNRDESSLYRAQGAHIMHGADIDGDGRDEVVIGSAAVDDNGIGLWSTGFGHPDFCFVGDIDPARPGLEVFYGIEPRRKDHGLCLVDAKTGKVIWGLQETSNHVGTDGMCADVDPRHPGLECHAKDIDAERKFAQAWTFSAAGEMLTKNERRSMSRTLFWDADLQKEQIRGSAIVKFLGGEYPGRIEGSVIAFADLLGDWREEIITSVAGELRI
ncbi:MAG: silent information regulator protein Sir2, partial [Planctomycetes bacterium]|nr:silent information regulator protein Sir2 [Planctomycetota bacterium]